MKESTFYYLMQESKIESECSDNKGEEYPSAFADKYNTYYQIAHSYVTGLVPAVEKYAREKCAEARIDFEQFRIHKQSFKKFLGSIYRGESIETTPIRYQWRVSEDTIYFCTFPFAKNVNGGYTFGFELNKITTGEDDAMYVYHINDGQWTRTEDTTETKLYAINELKNNAWDDKNREDGGYPAEYTDEFVRHCRRMLHIIQNIIPDMEEYAREECMAAGLDFEKFRMHHQSFLDLLNVTEQGKRNKEMILRYIWRKSENSICCAEVTWYVENGACVGCEPRLGKLEGDYIISEYNFEDSRWEMSGLER